MKQVIVSVVALMLLCCQFGERTKAVQQQRAYVIDDQNLLKRSERIRLTTLMMDIEQELGSQVAIVIVDSLGTKTINQLSINVFESLQLGREGYDDGLLILLAIEESEVRIEVGNGLELIIKDEIAAQILREQMVPKFSNNQFFEGLYLGINRIATLLRENKALIGKRVSY